jgi:hypothetical protein
MSNLIGRSRRAGGITGAEAASSALCALAFSVWSAVARDSLTWDVPVVFLSLALSFLLAGRLAARALDEESSRDVPTALVCGYFLVNSGLYLLAWLSPLPILVHALMILLVVVAAQFLWPPRAAVGGASSARCGLFALAIALAAASGWSQDSIRFRVRRPDGVLIKPWVDSFFHACEIRMFRDARGPSSLEDVRMSGGPAWFYHHASYLTTALVSAATATPAHLAFTSFHVPFGVVLSGLSAYALIRSLWGPGPGLAAAVALLLLPGAPYHGLANFWLSHRWMQQIAPGGLYGVAAVALAWTFMFRGCRSGRLALVALAFLTASLVVHYKSQLFVAVALPIWLYPGVFFARASRRGKAAWLAFAIPSFLAVAALAQHLDSVPTLRMDWSSAKEYTEWVGQWSRDEHTRGLFTSTITASSPPARDALFGAALLAYGTVGLFGVANLALASAVALRLSRNIRRGDLELAAFPLLTVLIYVLMFLGMSYDLKTTTYGLRDELRHRPLVWAYFVSASWAGGLAYRLFLDDAARRSRVLRRALIAAAIASLAFPIHLGKDIHLSTPFAPMFSHQVYPRGWLECARFIRANARPGDLVQDGECDPRFVLSAICEHPAYAIAYEDLKLGPALARRVEEIQSFKDLADAREIRRFAAERRIRWVVLHPGSKVRWPESLLARPVFARGGFRVYAFRDRRDAPGGLSAERARDPDPRSHHARAGGTGGFVRCRDILDTECRDILDTSSVVRSPPKGGGPCPGRCIPCPS